MATAVKEIENVYDHIEKVNIRKTTYVIFHAPNVKEAEYKIISVGESNNIRPNEFPSITDIKRIFNECKDEVLKYDFCYTAYDFYFNNCNGALRNIYVLISFINDETCPAENKFFYSSSSLDLLKQVHAAKHIPINSPNDFVYENFEEISRNHKKKLKILKI